MPDVETEPCFIVGAERSGSTLLRLALDGHPQLSFPHEYDFVTHGVNDRGERSDPEAYRRFLATNGVFRRSGFTIDPRLDVDALNASFLAQRRRGRRVAGGSVHGRFSRLLHLWPNARFIFLVRDPRAQSLSVVKMGWAGHVWRASELWLEAQREWALVMDRTGADRRLVVRYEDLAAAPAEALARICGFLGVAYEPAMLEIDRRSRYAAPSAKSLEDWREEMSERERALVDVRVFPAAAELGYAPCAPARRPPGGIERGLLRLADRAGRVRFAVARYGLPLYLARFASNRLGSEAWRRRVRERVWDVDQRYIR